MCWSKLTPTSPASIIRAYPPHMFLNLLIMPITNLMGYNRLSGTSSSGTFPFLRSPAIVQLLKLVIILPQAMPLSTPELSQHCMECLMALLHASHPPHTQLSQTPPLSDAETNRDALGLPWHVNPALSTLALETDRRLLHALSMHMRRDASLTTTCHALQFSTLKIWTLCAVHHSLSSETRLSMRSSMVGLAKQCMVEVQQLMFERAWGRLAPDVGKRLLASWMQQRQQKPAYRQQRAGQVQRIPQPPTPTEGSVNDLRSILVMLSGLESHTSLPITGPSE